MNNAQVQLKISLSPQLNDFLVSRASRLGVPTTQLVKHFIIKEIEAEAYPTFPLSREAEANGAYALRSLKKFSKPASVKDFLDQL